MPPDIAIVIPMLDEEKALPGVIANIAALSPAPVEVIAVDGRDQCARRVAEQARR